MSDAIRRQLGDRWRVIDEPKVIPVDLRGLSMKNFVNRPSGGGVQIELPVELRKEVRTRPRGRDALRLVEAICTAIQEIT